jgi:hypothetical protein
MKDPTLKIVMKKLTDIKPYENNAKEHPEEQVDLIVESIVHYGFCEPISIDKEGVIIKGHGRYLALQKLERKEAPCYVRDDLTPDEVRGLRIADNKVAESGTSNEKLKLELETINVEDTFTGYSPAEIQLIIDPPQIHNEASRSGGTAVLSFTIVFDSEEQQNHWFAFLRHLKANREEETNAAKIIGFLQDNADF